jgi:hypothetical protein
VLAAAAALCIPGAAQSAERSCAERALWAQLRLVVLPDAAQLALPQVVLKQ